MVKFTYLPVTATLSTCGRIAGSITDPIIGGSSMLRTIIAVCCFTVRARSKVGAIRSLTLLEWILAPIRDNQSWSVEYLLLFVGHKDSILILGLVTKK